MDKIVRNFCSVHCALCSAVYLGISCRGKSWKQSYFIFIIQGFICSVFDGISRNQIGSQNQEVLVCKSKIYADCFKLINVFFYDFLHVVGASSENAGEAYSNGFYKKSCEDNSASSTDEGEEKDPAQKEKPPMVGYLEMVRKTSLIILCKKKKNKGDLSLSLH